MQSVLILSVKEERRERMTGKEGRENKEIDSLVACFLKNDQLPILCIEVCSDSEEEMESMCAGGHGAPCLGVNQVCRSPSFQSRVWIHLSSTGSSWQS